MTIYPFIEANKKEISRVQKTSLQVLFICRDYRWI